MSAVINLCKACASMGDGPGDPFPALTQTSRLVFTTRLRLQFRMPPSFDRCTPPVQSEYPAERRAAAAVPLPESP